MTTTTIPTADLEMLIRLAKIAAADQVGKAPRRRDPDWPGFTAAFETIDRAEELIQN